MIPLVIVVIDKLFNAVFKFPWQVLVPESTPEKSEIFGTRANQGRQGESGRTG